MLPSLCISIVTFLTFAVSATPHGAPPAPNVHDFEESNPTYGSSKDHHDVESLCNKYTSTILGSNTPTNQRLLMALFVNTALVGNYTTPNVGVAVNGIIWPGKWKGQPVNLMPWFNGELASSNPCADDCGHGVSVNWLNGGGPEAMRRNLTSFEQGTNQLSDSLHLFHVLVN